MVALARLVSPEEDAAVVGWKVRHDGTGHDAAEVAVATAVDGGYVGLGEDSAVYANVIQVLGETLSAVVVIAYGVYGFTGGSRGIALVSSVQIEEGFVGGAVGNDHQVVPAACGIGGGQVELARILEVSVGVRK